MATSNNRTVVIKCFEIQDENEIEHSCILSIPQISFIYRYQLLNETVSYLYDEDLLGYYDITTDDPEQRQNIINFVKEISNLLLEKAISKVEFYQDNELVASLTQNKILRIECQDEFGDSDTRIAFRVLERK